MTDDLTFSVASSDEIDRRRREIRLLVNIIEPDPAYQPLVLTDLASVFDVTADDETKIRARLEFYLGVPLPVDLSIPLWQLVDAIQLLRSGWPGDPDASSA